MQENGPSNIEYAARMNYEQLPRVNHVNHQIEGKLAYLHLAIANKSITPMWDCDEQIWEALRTKPPLAHRPPDYSRARNVLPQFHRNEEELCTYTTKAIHLLLTRYNTLPPETVRLLIPQNASPSLRGGMIHQMNILAQESYRTAFDFLMQKCNRVIAFTGGKEFWIQIPERQRREIWGEVWDQYPWYALLRFRARQSQVVDFAALYGGMDEGRKVWQRYFRRVWVEMAESVYLNMIIEYKGWLELSRGSRGMSELGVIGVWGMVSRGRWLMQLGVLDEGDLPVWVGGMRDGTSGEVKEALGTSVDSEERDVDMYEESAHKLVGG
ncbi:hypothetical protein GLAREA_11526 [Glarea lozoyensis ATCC 20868]|uniref:Uncharacterized protein n=1 Tax=Glarea lozoyensis (strain ATCC 20868 / MF5171) TaxID=1116229 RepID=S3CGB3_GLAL2|nr:uncharacterized protein GLAREA_11526 [Glarea lozoyensis ATCC 20868]EPE24945.1 hypothetical protein GLAREA_11526 [Glarea lozoyensis ATCC 20868]